MQRRTFNFVARNAHQSCVRLTSRAWNHHCSWSQLVQCSISSFTRQKWKVFIGTFGIRIISSFKDSPADWFTMDVSTKKLCHCLVQERKPRWLDDCLAFGLCQERKQRSRRYFKRCTRWASYILLHMAMLKEEKLRSPYQARKGWETSTHRLYFLGMYHNRNTIGDGVSLSNFNPGTFSGPSLELLPVEKWQAISKRKIW